jgi:hypothetical protein
MRTIPTRYKRPCQELSLPSTRPSPNANRCVATQIDNRLEIPSVQKPLLIFFNKVANDDAEAAFIAVNGRHKLALSDQFMRRRYPHTQTQRKRTPKSESKSRSQLRAIITGQSLKYYHNPPSFQPEKQIRNVNCESAFGICQLSHTHTFEAIRRLSRGPARGRPEMNWLRRKRLNLSRMRHLK